MIVLDTSAIMAILLLEPQAEPCMKAIVEADHLAMSAATLAELYIVASAKGRWDPMERFLEGLDIEIVAVGKDEADRIGHHIAPRFGKRHHPAGLNFGDCFAYVLAEQRDCPLLYVGEDFAKTEIRSAVEVRA